MNVKNLICLVCALGLSSAAFAQQQPSLPELARAEKARRAKLRATSGPAKVYTESDRSGSVAAGDAESAETTTAGGGATASAVSGAKKEKTPQELAAEKQKDWNDRLKKAQDQITELEGVIQTNERNLASLINITPARTDLANRIEQDKKKLADLKQELVNLEDERRRAGLPRVK